MAKVYTCNIQAVSSFIKHMGMRAYLMYILRPFLLSDYRCKITPLTFGIFKKHALHNTSHLH